MDKGFIWEQLGYGSREEWVVAGKPTTPLEDSMNVESIRPMISQTLEADRAWAFVNKNGYKSEIMKDKTSNAIRVRDQNGRWICTIDIGRTIVYWNPTSKQGQLPGFQNRFPKNNY